MTPKEQQSALKVWQRWRRDPSLWVKARFGEKITLSSQQVNYFQELGKLISAKIKAHNDRGSLTEEDKLYASKIGVSIMAGQGVGKDFATALTMLYFLDVFPNAKVTATGVTGKHLRNVLWAECSKIMRLSIPVDPKDAQSETYLESVIKWQTERIYHKGARNPGAEWFAEAVTINPHSSEDEQAKTLYGRHEKYQLICIDEAASVPEPVFGPLEGTLSTGACNLALMIFNPTRANGYAYQSHHGKKDQWVALRWNAEESELISPEHIEKMRRYGVESNTYRVKVLGLPPLVGDGGLIPFEWIQDAIGREIVPTAYDPTILGCDIGGGGDRSVICQRQGGLIEKLVTSNERDTMKTAAWIGEHYHSCEASVAIVDSNGLGAGVADRLRELDFVVHPVEGQGKGDVRDERCLNNRAQMYMTLREQFENKAICIPDNPDLVDELGALKMEIDNVGKTKIGSKKDLRRALGFSPDLADGLALSYAVPDQIYRRGGNHHKPLPSRNYWIP